MQTAEGDISCSAAALSELIELLETLGKAGGALALQVQIQIIDARGARVEFRTCEERCGKPLLERDREQKN